jgi:hypothetical protein
MWTGSSGVWAPDVDRKQWRLGTGCGQEAVASGHRMSILFEPEDGGRKHLRNVNRHGVVSQKNLILKMGVSV